MARTPDDVTKAQVWADKVNDEFQFEFYIPQGSKGDPGGIVLGTAMANGADFNNYTTDGRFRFDGLTGALNAPPVSQMYGFMDVQTSGVGRVTQTVYPSSSGDAGRVIYQRNLAGGVWRGWYAYNSNRIDKSAGLAIYQWDNLAARDQLVYGDTGWRDVTSDFPTLTTGSVLIRRLGYTVYFRMNGLFATAGGNQVIGTLPDGFRPAFGDTEFLGHTGTGAPVRVNVTTNGNVTGYTLTTSHLITYSGSIAVSQAWPTTLPGTASGTIPNV